MASLGSWRYAYHLKDHLGNVRHTLFSKILLLGSSDLMAIHNAPIDYYPFGLEISNADASFNSGTNPYLYNGKEIDRMHGANWYDYGARLYDPVLGRWHTVDPHAENYLPVSPYAYVGNNPIIRIDPDGRDWYQAIDDEGNLVEGGAVMWREGSDAIDGYSNIGTSYTMNLGDGVSITYNQNTPETIVETVLNAGDWTTQRDPIYDTNGRLVGSRNKAGEEGNCFYQAGQKVSNSGATSLGRAANNEPSTNTVNYINVQIGTGSSVRVHVDYNGDGVGDHWVAISSRTTNLTNNTSTYNFYDPGTVSQASGTHNTNTFNVNNGTLSGTTFYNGRRYTVTAVRRNR